MALPSGISQELNPNYYVRKPGKTELLDEAIFYKRNEQYERPVEIINRPVIKETIFMPDRKVLPVAAARDVYTVTPEPAPTVYTTTTTVPTNVLPYSSFNLIRALGLHADCPCWAWLCIVFWFIVLLTLIGISLYYILKREGYF